MAVAAQTRTATARPGVASARRRKLTGTLLVNGILLLICIVWTVPSLGLLVSSFRTREDIGTTGWWTVVPHQEWVSTSQIQLERGVSLDKPLQVAGATVT